MRRAGPALAVVASLTLALGATAAGTTTARSINGALRAAVPAQPPFRGLGTTVVHVGGHVVHVVVAKTETQRQQGLRRRSNLGRYDGMLFVFDQTTNVAFTMSTVPVPLDIGFYGPDGRRVDQLRMEPCAHAESSCPIYQARGSFRYALETLAGAPPNGTLSG